jgi:hypothetical protein
LGAISASSAQAAYVMTFEQDGANVIETGAGSLDLTDLHVQTSSIVQDASVDPEFGRVFSGVFTNANSSFALLPESSIGFGSGSSTNASSTTGGPVGFTSGVADLTRLFFPVDYISDMPLSDSSTYLGASIVSLGLAPGAYVATWGAGDHADSFTVNVVTSPPLVPEPSTWAMMLIGFAGLGYAAARRKGAVRAISA